MKWFWALVSILITGLLVWVNVLLYRPVKKDKAWYQDVRAQLAFLESELKVHDLGSRMQQLYPEGYVFIHALYGLAWAELAQRDIPETQALKSKAIEEVLYAYHAIDSDEGKWPFSQYMIPEYGAYYAGWRNYLLAKLLSIDADFPGKAALQEQFQKQSLSLTIAFREFESPYLASYPQQSWPADSFLAVASLALHDRLFEPIYDVELKNWLKKVKSTLDPETGMIPHKTDVTTGSTIQGSRGGSIALMLRLLAEIDTEFALDQYQLFEANFVSTAVGLPMVREYPKGVWGTGDIDSGPVIFGTGFAATIMGMGTYKSLGIDIAADRQYQVIHAFGLSRVQNGERSYLLGSLPMADAFIAWTRVTPPVVMTRQEIKGSNFWRLKFQTLCMLLLLLAWLPFYKKRLVNQYNQWRRPK